MSEEKYLMHRTDEDDIDYDDAVTKKEMLEILAAQLEYDIVKKEKTLDKDKKHTIEISNMNVYRLLQEVLSNPEYITNSYFKEYKDAIEERAGLLGVFSK